MRPAARNNNDNDLRHAYLAATRAATREAYTARGSHVSDLFNLDRSFKHLDEPIRAKSTPSRAAAERFVPVETDLRLGPAMTELYEGYEETPTYAETGTEAFCQCSSSVAHTSTRESFCDCEHTQTAETEGFCDCEHTLTETYEPSQSFCTCGDK